MITYYLEFTLQSDAIFSRGDGVAGLVDIEIQHDEYGLPYLAGRTIKGLLVQECADILDALSNAGISLQRWEQAAERLFGIPGEQESMLAIDHAMLANDLRESVAHAIQRQQVTPDQVLNTLTTIRRQTAMEAAGTPKAHSLRSVRVIIRDVTFHASLHFIESPRDDELMLLAASIRAWRRAGSSRNRGFGRLTDVKLLDDRQKDITQTWVDRFFKEVGR